MCTYIAGPDQSNILKIKPIQWVEHFIGPTHFIISTDSLELGQELTQAPASLTEMCLQIPQITSIGNFLLLFHAL